MSVGILQWVVAAARSIYISGSAPPNATTAERHAARGWQLIDRGCCEDAICEFDMAIAANRDSFNAWGGKGGALMRLGSAGQAAPCYREVARLCPDVSEGWLNLAIALTALEECDEALDAAERAVQLDPRAAVAWAAKGSILTLLGRTREGLECDDRALTLQPNYTTALMNKAGALASLGRLEESLHCYDQVLTTLSQYPQVWIGKGLVLCQLSRVSSGIECLRRARILIERQASATSQVLVSQRKDGFTVNVSGAATLEQLDKAISLCSDLPAIFRVTGVRNVQFGDDLLLVILDRDRTDSKQAINDILRRHPGCAVSFKVEV